MSSDSQTKPDAAEVAAKQEILALTEGFVRGFNANDLGPMMKFYADRYVDVNLKQPVQTKAERTAYYKAILDRHDTTVEVHPDEILVRGDAAFARGSIIVIRRVAGQSQPTHTELRYIEIWQRFPDGWKSIWGMDAELYPEKK